ncbi:MAG TPA: Rrf2 family transcriptional regulator [Candidatus Corynebacterium avicola]|uniref:Rrf2 family transcriptional regulator n=1 Tax=Candidatus Corynebacterium avicola TaxID=2838527 RepID=A0A9D1ULC7_9CORY|nr:Rrf2 family transcriptional regulator [Candidatus Corynebacterium avicola]
MHLTKFTDLGLRSLMILGDTGAAGATDPSQRRTVGELAVQTNAPASHVKKVVARLTGLGILESVRGRSGGVCLADGGRSTDVGALIRDLEGHQEVVDCDGDAPCPLAGRGCHLRHMLADAQERFFATFDGITLGELIDKTPPAGPVSIGLPGPAPATH